MKIVAEVASQVRVRGQIRFVRAGEVVSDFPDNEPVPNLFVEVGRRAASSSGGVDFDKMSADEVRASLPDLDALKKFVKEQYPEVDFAPNIGWQTLCNRYLDARVDRVRIEDNTGRTKVNNIQNVTDKLSDLDVEISGGENEGATIQDDEFDELFKNDEE
jgi:hypothetical protein